MTSERSKRRDFLSLIFISKHLLKDKLLFHQVNQGFWGPWSPVQYAFGECLCWSRVRKCWCTFMVSCYTLCLTTWSIFGQLVGSLVDFWLTYSAEKEWGLANREIRRVEMILFLNELRRINLSEEVVLLWLTYWSFWENTQYWHITTV